MAGADGDGQRIEPGFRDEILGLHRVGEMVLYLGVAQSRAVAVFNAAQASQLAFDSDAQRMGVLDDSFRDRDILFVGVWRFAVFGQRPVHHNRGESQRNGFLAGLQTVAVIEMHGHGDMGVFLHGRFHQFFEINHLAVFQRAAAGLDNHRAVGVVGGLHDGLDLLHVVDVECANAITAFCGLIQNLSHGY